MRKRSSKRTPPKDINQLAASILAQAVGEPGPLVPTGKKNPAAVTLGRLGGLKGGKARADKLSAMKRTEIALQAARARWDKKKSDA